MSATKKSRFVNALKDDEHLQPVARPSQTAGNGRRKITEGESIVAAQLPIIYSRRLAMLAAEEGVSKKDLIREAFELLFSTRGRAGT